jgi:hypothetical protein
MRPQFICLVIVSLLAVAPARTARASPPASEDGLWWDFARALAKSEAAEMLFALLGGSQMGPGEGWFHPGQSRYDWAWLARRCGAAEGGRVERAQFPGTDEEFLRLDRDRDGALTAADYDWSDASPLNRQMALAAGWLRRGDADGDGRITKAEWLAAFEKAAAGRDHLTAEDLRALLYPPQSPAGPPEAPSRAVLLSSLLSGEIGSVAEGPPLNGQAPDFALPTHDGARSVRLAQFRGQRPVVLIFGSFT